MIKKCLFPVAGYGTRFLPATKAMPKEILPIVNKPLVQYGVEEAAEAGFTSSVSLPVVAKGPSRITSTSAMSLSTRLPARARKTCLPPSGI